MVGIAVAGSAVVHELMTLKQPFIDAWYNSLQVQLGIPAAPLQRAGLYAQNRADQVNYPSGQDYFAQPGSRNRALNGANVIPDVAGMVAWANMQPWGNMANMMPAPLREKLYDRLSYHGIDPIKVEGWAELIDRSVACLDLETVIYLYHRGMLGEAVLTSGEHSPKDLLEWYFRRYQIPRDVDRDRMLHPAYRWTVPDVQRYLSVSELEDADKKNLLRSVKLGNEEDREILEALQSIPDLGITLARYRRGEISEASTIQAIQGSGVIDEDVAAMVARSAWELPDGDQAAMMTARRAFDDALAAQYGLDAGLTPLVRRQYAWGGLPQPTGGGPIETAVAGGVDWVTAQWRAGRNLPGFGELLEMQWRLRPSGAADGSSVIAGVPAWTETDTRNILSMQGHTPPLIDRMMGLARSPINVRIVMAVLHEILTHKQVADDAQVAYGAGTDWVKSVFMDQGLTEPVAKLASDAIQAKADDLLQIERTELEKKTRADRRKTVLELYRVGSLSSDQAAGQLVGEFVPGELATELLAVVDLEVTHTVVTDQITALERGYQSGKVSRASAVVAMTALLITPVRQQQYLTQWDWRRTEDRTMLSTREVLQLLKDGLLTQPVALQRLLNLGWDNGDALIELAAVQHDLAVSGARVAAANARRAESAAAAQQRSESSAARAAVSAESRQAAAEARAEREARSRAGVDLVVDPELAHALAASAAATAKHAVAVEKAKGDPIKVQAANAALVVAQDAYTQAVARIHAREVTGDVAPIPQQ